jgi:hypothetical protein
MIIAVQAHVAAEARDCDLVTIVSEAGPGKHLASERVFVPAGPAV